MFDPDILLNGWISILRYKHSLTPTAIAIYNDIFGEYITENHMSFTGTANHYFTENLFQFSILNLRKTFLLRNLLMDLLNIPKYN